MHSMIAMMSVLSLLSMPSELVWQAKHTRHHIPYMQYKHSVPAIFRFHRKHAMRPMHRIHRMKEWLSMQRMLSLTTWHCNHPRQRNTEKQHLLRQVTRWHPLAANGYCTAPFLWLILQSEGTAAPTGSARRALTSLTHSKSGFLSAHADSELFFRMPEIFRAYEKTARYRHVPIETHSLSGLATSAPGGRCLSARQFLPTAILAIRKERYNSRLRPAGASG